jgi:hypothetical protein
MKLSELSREEHLLLLDALRLKFDEIERCLSACKPTWDDARKGTHPALPHVIEAYERQLTTTRQLYDAVKRADISG